MSKIFASQGALQITVLVLSVALAALSTASTGVRRYSRKFGDWSPSPKVSEVSITSTKSPAYPYFLPNESQSQLWSSNQNQTGTFHSENSFGYSLDTDPSQISFTTTETPPRQPEANFETYDVSPLVTRVDSYLPENYAHSNPDHHYGGYGYYGHHNSGGHKPEFEIEDKLFTKTIAATKVLKAGKMVFTICMVLVVLVLAGLGKLGVVLSPAALPLALLPIGFIALILFVPLFLLYVPIVATGHAGGEGRRRKRNVKPIQKEDELDVAEVEEYFSTLEQNFLKFVEKIG